MFTVHVDKVKKKKLSKVNHKNLLIHLCGVDYQNRPQRKDFISFGSCNNNKKGIQRPSSIHVLRLIYFPLKLCYQNELCKKNFLF
jgi:hypothetical protein